MATLLLATANCATAPRFRDQPIVWRADDQKDIEKPEENDFRVHLYFGNLFLFRAVTRGLELLDQEPARNTNALDEVPDSTWFTNRIGVQKMSPEDAAKGPDVDGPPQLPLTVFSGKSAGGNPGFFASDHSGRKFLVKFDTPANPEMQTATDAIVSRILWTAGYNVPADYVFEFSRADLKVGAGAKMKDELGAKRLMSEADLDAVLKSSPRLPDGGVRALASRLLAGAPLGGAEIEGEREDDPNDTIPHEHRRELRGLRIIAAWLNHTDMKEDNTLDMYVEEGSKRFVRHYLVDFGEAFGSHAAEKGRFEDGYEYFWDWEAQPLGLLSFGLWKRDWENLKNTPWPAIGAFEAEHFDPEAWKEAYPYYPFSAATETDDFWGA